MYLQKTGLSYTVTPLNITLTLSEVHEVFVSLCRDSVYTHEQEISSGFISLPCGSRAGVTGNYILKPDGRYWIRDITSINIRIASEVTGFANKLMGEVARGSILICGAPNSGKTTLLRDYIRAKSNLGTKISLVDVRCEISGFGTLDVGLNTDVATGGNKALLIENSLRSMAPEIIAFDEIGTVDELERLKDCLSSGVDCVATFHARSKEELILRNRFLPVLNLNVFNYLVFINHDYGYTVERIDLKDAETNWCNCGNTFVLDDRDVVLGGTCKTCNTT